MPRIPFREFHLYELMKLYREKKLPLDLVISDYFRANKSLGSKDRAFIGDTAYQMVRWKGLYEYLSKKTGDWEASYRELRSSPIDQLIDDQSIPIHHRYGCPEPLFHLLVKYYGESKACELCLIFNERAPLTIRVNTLKTDRETLLKRWENKYDVSECQEADQGIIFHEKVNCFGMQEFKDGLFEIQDEGSQLLGDLVKVEPGQHFLDYCAGAGGKSLAIAPRMKQKGQLYLHDIRANALSEAKKRLKRAGIQNAQIVKNDMKTQKRLKKKMDWVLVDAPCSGTGTLRRNPDMKWRFDQETIPQLVGLQRAIFERALSFVKPGGRIVYSTCSVLPDENQHQVEHFLKTYNIALQSDSVEIIPRGGGMDGFFGVVFFVRG